MTTKYLRTEMSPEMAPPATETGIIGWVAKNLLSSWLSGVLTVFGAYVIYLIVPVIVQFAFIDAVWSGKNGLACRNISDGGIVPDGQAIGACWPYVDAYFSQFIYGRYPVEERWRVDIAMFVGVVSLIPLLIPTVPFKRENAIFMLGVYPILVTILLTGGNIGVGTGAWGILVSLMVLGAGFVVFQAKTTASITISAGLKVIAIFGALVAIVFLALSFDWGMSDVETPNWGGLLVTLVVAITGIVASFPIGILLALGRRSEMPVTRLVSVIFIEFWRGVPLITVLFMSSVMLPLFLPEGVQFDKLLRVLIGVTLFSAAYMAETVRGGLQAISRGQYEGAMALGLSFWQMMGLIILPQALKLVIPGIVNAFIGLFKDTTLVLIVGLFDLLGQVQSSFTDPNWSSPVTSHTGYLFTAAVFWVFCFGMSRYSIFMENLLHRGHKR
jgi:general L-amino acid transport system permease protein